MKGENRCHDVSSNDLFLDVPHKYETRYLLCCEHIETCSPDGCKACSEVPKGYVDYGLKYEAIQRINLEGYVDSDWAGSAINRKSTLGCCFSMRLGVISSFSKKESCMALSTGKEKYVATCSTIWKVVCLF